MSWNKNRASADEYPLHLIYTVSIGTILNEALLRRLLKRFKYPSTGDVENEKLIAAMYVTIYSNGVFTVAILPRTSGTESFIGVSKRNAVDPIDFRIGARIAVKRVVSALIVHLLTARATRL